MSEEKKKNRAAVALGRRGGKMRAARLSAEELSAQGRRAAAVRWGTSKPMVDVLAPVASEPEVVITAIAEPPRRTERAVDGRDSNAILTLKEQGYEVGERALHPDGCWRVSVRSRELSAWATTGEELLDLAAGRLTLEEVMKRRQSALRSASAGG